MRKEHRPYWMRRLNRRIQRAWSRHYLEPQFDAVGPHLDAAYPWFVDVYGPNITIGRSAVLRTTPQRHITLTTWTTGEREGSITIGDYVLISPGTSILSSDAVTIGSNTMIAGEVYISDSDWHDTYDRTQELGRHRPIVLGENVWIGYGAKICKGVTIGDNSIIGAGAVVLRDIPANVIAAGNPARPVRDLDPQGPFVKRETLYADHPALTREMEQLEKYLLRENSVLKWLRHLAAPSRRD